MQRSSFSVGRFISTKYPEEYEPDDSVDGRMDITHDYKYPEGNYNICSCAQLLCNLPSPFQNFSAPPHIQGSHILEKNSFIFKALKVLKLGQN